MDDVYIPPHDKQMERVVIGCLLLAGADADVSPQLDEDCFHLPPHVLAYQVIRKLINEGAPVDVVSVCRGLAAEGVLENAGGASYISSMLSDVPHSKHAGYYSKCLIDLWADRHTHHLVSMVQHGKMDRKELRFEIDQIEARTSGKRVIGMGEAITEYEQSRKFERRTVKSGLFQLDEHLDGGFEAGQLVILSAMTGNGKTAFATSMLVRISDQGKSAMVISLEMTRKEIVERMISAKAGVPLTKIKRKTESGRQDEERLMAQNALYNSRVLLDDSSTTIDDICRQAMHHRDKIDLLIVDYLQLVESTSGSNREQEVAKVSRRLKLLAKELEIPVIALAQMNRESQKRTSTVPRLSDLRESSAIAQDANIVMFLHKDEERSNDERQLIIAKNRSGRTGIVNLKWIPEITAFRNYEAAVDTSVADQFLDQTESGGF